MANIKGRWLLLLIVLGMLGTVSGCWSRGELNDVAVVTGVAIDKGESQPIRLSVGLLRPQALDRDGGGGEKETTFVVTEEGETIFDCIRRLARNTGRRLWWGHMEMLIFSEEMAKAGLAPYLDFFLRDAEPRPTTWVAVFQGEAREALKMQMDLDPVLAFGLSDMVEGRKNHGEASGMQIYEFFRQLTSEMPAPIGFLIGQKAEDGKMSPRAGGTALFKGDRLLGTLDGEETKGYLLLIGEFRSGIIPVGLPGYSEKIGVEVIEAESKAKPGETPDGKPQVQIQVKVRGVVGDNLTDERMGPEEFFPAVAEALQKKVREMGSRVLAIAQEEYGYDIFQFGNRYWQTDPQGWQKHRERWKEDFGQVEVLLEVETEIKHGNLIERRSYAVP